LYRYIAVTVVDASGKALGAPVTTPIGSATPRSDGTVVFNANVDLQTTYGGLPEGGAVMLELRHFKVGGLYYKLNACSSRA
jgi:hypothetical protein